MVWVWFSMFFQKSKAVFEKWTFINVLFSFFDFRFEKKFNIHYFGVRHPIYANLTFMLLVCFNEMVTCKPLCCGLYSWTKSCKNGRKVGKVILLNSWIDVLGDILKTCRFKLFWYIYKYIFLIMYSYKYSGFCNWYISRK